MVAPVWITTTTNLGTIQHGVEFSRQLLATDAVNYSLVSGELPVGAELNQNTGLIAGTAYEQNYNSNRPLSTFIFTIRATNTAGEFTEKIFKIYLLSQELLLPIDSFDQYRVAYSSTTFKYQITRGQVNTDINLYWRLDFGSPPDGGDVFQNGSIEVNYGRFILPFTLETFLKPGAVITTALRNSWNEFARQQLALPSNDDHQFIVSLRDSVNPIQFSVTIRITYLRVTGNEDWFTENASVVGCDPGQTYSFLSSSDSDFIEWKTGANLVPIANGSISDLDVEAVCLNGKRLVYSLKPGYEGNLPLGLVFYPNGIIAGRVGFRCHVDDPTRLPVNDNYEFIVRAKTIDNVSFVEKKFLIHVDRVHSEPYVNVWIRSFPIANNRQVLDRILQDPVYFPDRLMYRPNDPWFSKTSELRFLFAPGLAVKSIEEYYQALENNHYDKTLLLGPVKTASAYDQNLKVKYEVVYVPVVDNYSKTNAAGVVQKLPNTIDLRTNLQNFFWVNGNPIYTFKPNGLENMRSQLEQSVGYYNSGILPLWMISPQPVPGKRDQFYPPMGFQQAIVLCYTVPGGSEIIAYRLRRAGINFNDFRFEFDRYELDDNLTRSFDPTADDFTDSTETLFDDGTTIFEDSTTRFNRLTDYVGGQGPGVGNKYLKFPKTGAFR